jgi:hypothetical protein
MSNVKPEAELGRLKETDAVDVPPGDARLEGKGEGDRSADVLRRKVEQVFDPVRAALHRAPPRGGPC